MSYKEGKENMYQSGESVSGDYLKELLLEFLGGSMGV
jgi:hypothetical protein